MSNYIPGEILFVWIDETNHRILTPGKYYKAIVRQLPGGCSFKPDDGHDGYLQLRDCAYLNGRNWNILPKAYSKYYERFGQVPPKELEEFLCQN